MQLGPGSEDIEYVFYVVAETDAASPQGQSAPSNPSKPITILPVAPQTPPVVQDSVAGPRSLNFTLQSPADSGGRPVTEFLARDPSSGDVLGKSLAGTTWIFLQDLDVLPIDLEFAADTVVGRSPWTEVATYTPGAGPPSMPLDVVPKPGDGQVVINFNPPLDDGGSLILSYTAFSSNPSGFNQTLNVGDLTEGEALSITVKNLDNDKKYQFQVFATNAIGDGEPSLLSQTVETGREFTVKEWVAGIAAAVLFLSIIIATGVLIW